jgi:hypothetical protein
MSVFSNPAVDMAEQALVPRKFLRVRRVGISGADMILEVGYVVLSRFVD